MKRVALYGALGVALWLVVVVIYVLTQLPSPGDTRIVVSPEIVGLHSGGAYAWLIVRSDDVVLIDTGGDAEAPLVVEELAKHGKAVADVDAVIVTHGHRDHHAAAALFPNATIYIGAADHSLLRGDELPHAVLAKVFTQLTKKPQVASTVREVRAAELIHVGALELEVVATPGHTAGSIMVLFSDVLFTGDSLWLDGDAARLAPWLVSDDVGTNARTLERLEKLAWHGVADGHVGYAADGRARYERLAASFR